MIELYELYVMRIAVTSICIFFKTNQYYIKEKIVE